MKEENGANRDGKLAMRILKLFCLSSYSPSSPFSCLHIFSDIVEHRML